MTPLALSVLIYLLFFLSGTAALIYQVVWVRSLTLVFGGSHLAVTTVLATFMAGLAAGSFVVGRRVDAVARPLRLYGLLELGIAASALAFAGLMKAYPAIYVALAHGRDDATLYLTAVRMLFSVVALIVPTVLMGATLPVLSRFVSRAPQDLRSQLSFLYGFNTLGAVTGALLAGFVLLRLYSVSASLYVAIALNALIGVVSVALDRRLSGRPAAEGEASALPAGATPAEPAPFADDVDALPLTLVLWGIGLSGFCALGYEVLWTRVLTIAVGASVYSFTIMLAAFLTGIALGSKAYGLAIQVFRIARPSTRRIVASFGTTQVMIGVTALIVSVYLRDIPANTVRLQNYFLGDGAGSFAARMGTNFSLSFIYMVVPAFFMGAAFPLAVEAVVRRRRAVGRAVGDVLASNTAGAILGTAIGGLVMVRLFGIERSLQMLTVLNIGMGLLVLASLLGRRWLTLAGAVSTLAVLTFLALNRDALTLWDRTYFAIFRSNQPEAFRTPEMVRDAVENTDVLFYGEGLESIVSVIKVKGGEQAFITNGRVEASTYPQALQVQYTLGHLPMLLNRNPRQVLVVGLGSGMTAGATLVHPAVERVTLAEIEPQVVGVARTFAAYNHQLLDNPKLQIVFNDGRNYLLTTDRTFDVITADPIHPWFRGAGYLYASEYFALAAARLNPGGVVAQWLPLYELTPQDLASVVKTFQQHFPYALLWLNHYDSVLVGSTSPLLIDEAELEKRLAEPAVANDLKQVTMGSATDFLSYFAMGGDGLKRFGRYGTFNTDDRLYLEFSAPFSIARPALMAANVKAIAAHRESLVPYLAPSSDPAAREQQRDRWERQTAAAATADAALALLLAGSSRDPAFLRLLRQLEFEHPSYAPGRFLANEYRTALALEPRLLQQSSFPLMNEGGGTSVVEMSAVLVPVSRTRASLMFVDNRARTVYGQSYIDNYDEDDRASRLALEVIGAVMAVYESEALAARQRQQAHPAAAWTLSRIKTVIDSKVQRGQPQS